MPARLGREGCGRKPWLLRGARGNDWFRGKDSNLRSRIQSPLPYLLATPEKLPGTNDYRAQRVCGRLFWAGHVTSGRPAAFRTRVRALLISLLLVATAACGAYRFPGETTPGTGTVSGHVTAVPCFPVEQANQPPCARAVAGVEIDFSGNGTTVGTQTDAKGFYSVTLAEGTWKVNVRLKSF